MPKEKEDKVQEAPAKSGEAEEQVVVVLNPVTGLLGYAFDDGFSAQAKKKYSISRSDYDKYKSEKHNDKQVLIKA